MNKTIKILSMIMVIFVVGSFMSPLFICEASSECIYIVNDVEYESIAQYGKKTLISPKDITSSEIDSQNQMIKINLDESVKSDDVLFLRFTARTQTQSGKINVKVNDLSFNGNYEITTELNDYFIPITGFTEIKNISISLTTDNQVMYIGNVELVNYQQTDVTSLKTGIYNIEPSHEKVELPEKIDNTMNACDITSDGQYIYAVSSSGILYIYLISQDKSLELISTTNGFGILRDVCLSDDGNTLALTSRKSGFYLVDISDKQKPVVLSQTATLELATGGKIVGNYYFVANRFFGLEIYDITDKEKPQYCSQVSHESYEYFDSSVENGYLYVTSWAGGKVHIYNIQDIYNPTKISEIKLNGTGSDVVVSEGVLYAVTGYNSRDVASSVSDPGYGAGNGVEIYDVSNPKFPKFLSEVSTDGRCKRSGGNDHWRVKLSGEFLYVSNSLQGTMILDVSNPKAPKKVKTVVGNIEKSNPSYKTHKQTSSIIPCEIVGKSRACFGNVAIVDGCVYFSSIDNGIYKYDFNEALKEETHSEVLYGTQKNIDKKQYEVEGYSVSKHSIDGTAYQVDKKGNQYYCAAGNGGIYVLDEQMNVLSKIETSGSVYDVKICGDYLYSAQGSEGLGIYIIKDDGLELISQCLTENSIQCFTSISIFPDGNHIAVEAGYTEFIIIDATDRYNPIIEMSKKCGTMYQRDLVIGNVSGKYVGQFDGTSMNWYSIDNAGQIVQLPSLSSVTKGEANGVAAYGEYAIAMYNSGYIYYNPTTVTDLSLKSVKLNKIPGITTKLQGKLSVANNVLLISYGQAQRIVLVDIKDLDNPSLIANVKVVGNPDVGFFDGNDIIIPLRHEGILRLKKEENIIEKLYTCLSNNGKTFTINPFNVEKEKMVILALYDGDRLVEIQSSIYTGESISFTTTKEYTGSKVFAWDSLTNMKSVCGTEIVK